MDCVNIRELVLKFIPKYVLDNIIHIRLKICFHMVDPNVGLIFTFSDCFFFKFLVAVWFSLFFLLNKFSD